MEREIRALDRHFALPRVRVVAPTQAYSWLTRGWQDMRASPVASLAYGVFFAVIGHLILTFAAPRPYLISAAISGFVLIGPLVAVGLYALSRAHDQGHALSLKDSLLALRQHLEPLFPIAIFLALVTLAWERISAVLFALLFPGDIVTVSGFMSQVLSSEFLGFIATYLLVGGFLAALIFALTVVAIPMMMDRDVDMVTAMMTSLRAASVNLRAMLVWAGIIAALIAFGFATMMIALIVILPLLGHASWHAYRDLVD